MSSPKKQTATDRVRTILADEIARGIIGPGVVLDEASLAERFEVSRTPIREAIRQLEAIGFATARPHRGAVVPLFTPEKLTEMFAVMAEMEALCAQYAALHALPEGKARLQLAHEACRLASLEGDIDIYYAANVRFHEVIYEIGRNTFLAEMTISVRNRLMPFRKAQFRSTGRLSLSLREHARVVESILAGDAHTASQTMREHMMKVRNTVGDVSPTLRQPGER
ncbi:GntR family transcriptional regulator [Ancylobacter sp. A5.8]|uniref:GntR family transcriptional regulator n=1 Tax=Ancylobacter gelatini TaxID=2919920 RepID=UPI001F4D7A15|nr:GntR family transcriptional regulator [Ancylobacter gelatini]MCJ8143672.1 GntR family transcriptional regulator [Ancylobacter gelatini]